MPGDPAARNSLSFDIPRPPAALINNPSIKLRYQHATVAVLKRGTVRKTIFHERWWLDIVAPDQWAEIVTDRGYLRYAYRTRMMFRSSQMPPLTRALGPVIQVDGRKTETRHRGAFNAICELLDRLPDFDHVEFKLDPSFTDVLAFQARGFHASVQHTFQADCRQPIENIWSEMRDKTRNIVRRAQDKLAVVATDDGEGFKNFYAQSLDRDKSYFGLYLIPELFAAGHARGQARILAAVDQGGEVHAQAFFLWDDHSYYYFLSSRQRAIAHAGAVSALIWAGMKHAHSLGLVFDFDGVTSQSRYQFMVGFGGKLATRFAVARGALLYDAQRGARAFKNRLIGRAAASFY